MRAATLRRAFDACLVAIFLGALFGSWADMLLNVDPTPVPSENRVLSRWPARPARWADAGAFRVGLADYFYDHFGFRRLFLKWNGDVRLLVSESPSPRVVLGRDHWLFYAGNDVVEDYLGRRPLHEGELDTWSRTLAERRERLARRGAAYLFIVAPDKTTIYPEYLPAALGSRRETTLDQIDQRVRDRNGLSLLTMIDDLRRAKSAAQVYYRTDTHWTTAGLQAAEAAVMSRLGRHAAASPPVESVAAVHGGDLARMLSGPPQYAETIVRSVPAGLAQPLGRDEIVTWRDESIGQTVTCTVVRFDQPGGRDRVLMFGDSFGRDLAPYLAEHFATLMFVPMHPDTATFSVLTDRFGPNLVLEERTERYLKYPPRQAPFADRRKGWMAAE